MLFTAKKKKENTESAAAAWVRETGAGTGELASYPGLKKISWLNRVAEGEMKFRGWDGKENTVVLVISYYKENVSNTTS